MQIPTSVFRILPYFGHLLSIILKGVCLDLFSKRSSFPEIDASLFDDAATVEAPKGSSSNKEEPLVFNWQRKEVEMK